MPATDKAVEVLHLVKNYGDVRAVKDISFEVKRGELFAFLGLNGAGKSTTINLLPTILPHTTSQAIVDCSDLERHRAETKRRTGIPF